MSDHLQREDLSRFLVHLTRDYDGTSADDNLISILRQRCIKARNAHCLFSPKVASSTFSRVLKKQFQTVCFTEAPLNQLRHLTKEIPGRSIALRPYGVVFWKDKLLEAGANPALYVSSQAQGLRKLLLSQFDEHFRGLDQYKQLQKKYGDDADAIVRYYSMVNIISDRHDFSWEREWRIKGDFRFDFDGLVAIIAESPVSFRTRLRKKIGSKLKSMIARVPIISPDWSYEQLVEEMAMRIWQKS